MKVINYRIATLIIVLAAMWTALGYSALTSGAQAQAKTWDPRQTQFTKDNPPDMGYYTDPAIWLDRITRGEKALLKVNVNPQVPGGLWDYCSVDGVPAKKALPPGFTCEKLTRAKYGDVLMASGKEVSALLHPTDSAYLPNGRKDPRGIWVIKYNGVEVAIVNCGNGFKPDLVVVSSTPCPTPSPETIYKECKPNPAKAYHKAWDKDNNEIFDPAREASEAVKIEDYDGCQKVIQKFSTSIYCEQDTWKKVFEYPSMPDVPQGFNGKLGKNTKVDGLVSQIPSDLQKAVRDAIGKDKIAYLLLFRGVCEADHNRILLRWFTKDGGWHWKEFIIGFGAGLITGYIVRGGGTQLVKNTPVPPRVPPPGIKEGGTSLGSSSGWHP